MQNAFGNGQSKEHGGKLLRECDLVTTPAANSSRFISEDSGSLHSSTDPIDAGLVEALKPGREVKAPVIAPVGRQIDLLLIERNVKYRPDL